MTSRNDLAQQRLELLAEATDIKLKRGSSTEHAQSCKCLLCLKAKLTAFEARAKLALRGGAKPSSPDQTIPVKAHWRTGKNHLKNDPELRELVLDIVRKLLAEQQKGRS